MEITQTTQELIALLAMAAVLAVTILFFVIMLARVFTLAIRDWWEL